MTAGDAAVPLVVGIFVLAYLGMALGRFPGLRIDRTGIAVIAAIALFGIGAVPAVILILSVWPELPEGTLHALAVLSTLAGNLFLVGSLASLIVVERARSVGVTLSFRDHARSGVPITLISSAAVILWLWLAGVLPLF